MDNNNAYTAGRSFFVAGHSFEASVFATAEAPAAWHVDFMAGFFADCSLGLSDAAMAEMLDELRADAWRSHCEAQLQACRDAGDREAAALWLDLL